MTERSGFGLIPAAAKVLAGGVVLAGGLAASLLYDQRVVFGFGFLLGAAIGGLLAGFVLLAGYVYADANRRGMHAWGWTALAVLVPNGLGFVLYFLLRKPRTHPCARCGGGVAADAAFCSRCGQAQWSGAGEPCGASY